LLQPLERYFFAGAAGAALVADGADLVADAVPAYRGVVMDVGANCGATLLPFAFWSAM